VYEELYAHVSESEAYLVRGPEQYACLRRFKSLARDVLSAKPSLTLDVGCGDGVYGIFFAHHSLEYVGADMSSQNLMRLNNWASRQNVKPSVSVVLCDVGHLPFRRNAFPLILCTEVLEHLPEPDRALREISNLNSQTLLVSTPCIGGVLFDRMFEYKTQQLDVAVRRMLAIEGVYLGLKRLYEARKDLHITLFTRTKLLRMLRKAGFRIKSTKGCAFHIPLLYWLASRSTMVGRLLGRLEDILLSKLLIFRIMIWRGRIGNEFIIIKCERERVSEKVPRKVDTQSWQRNQ